MIKKVFSTTINFNNDKNYPKKTIKSNKLFRFRVIKFQKSRKNREMETPESLIE